MVLNGATLNGAALNGGARVYWLGTAAIAASAEFSATAVRNLMPAASIDASASFTAEAHTLWGGASGPAGSAEFSATALRTAYPSAAIDAAAEAYPNPFLRHAGSAAFDGSASILAFVLRYVDASASFVCTANIDAIAQGFFGAANFDGTGAVSPTLTYIWSTATATGLSGTAAFSATASITRYPAAIMVLGTAHFTAAYRVASGGVTTYYSGAEIGCTAELENTSIFFNCDAIMECTSSTEFEPTQAHACSAAFPGAAELAATAVRVVLPATITIEATGAVSATGVVTRFGSGSMSCTGEIQNWTVYVNHAAGAAFDAASEPIVANMLMNRSGVATIDGSAEMTGTATRMLMPVAAFGGTADIWGNGMHLPLAAGEAQPTCTAELSATASHSALHRGSAEISATAELAPNAIRTVLPTVSLAGAGDLYAAPLHVPLTPGAASISATGELVATGLRLIPATASVSGTAAFDALAHTNMDADDPDERTMRRPHVDREMRRPFVDREMREAA